MVVANVHLSAAGQLDAKSGERAIRGAQQRHYRWHHWQVSSCAGGGASAGEEMPREPGPPVDETTAYEASSIFAAGPVFCQGWVPRTLTTLSERPNPGGFDNFPPNPTGVVYSHV